MGDAITRNAGVTASERHRFLAQVPAPRRRVLHFGKCACKRQLVLSLTSAGLGEQKANQAVRGPLGSLVISLRHCQTSVMAIPGKSPVPRKGPRSTPPGPVGACIRKMRVQRQLVPSRTSAGLGEQKANQVVCGVARKLRLPSLVLIGRAGTGRSRIGFRLRQHCAGELASPAHGVVPVPRRDTTHHLRFPEGPRVRRLAGGGNRIRTFGPGAMNAACELPKQSAVIRSLGRII